MDNITNLDIITNKIKTQIPLKKTQMDIHTESTE